MASVAFPALSSTVAPAPSALWSANLTAPYPTNAPWQSMVLGQGGNPELVTPYLVQSAEGRIAWGLLVRDPQPGYIVHAFATALMLSMLQGLPAHQLSAYDDLFATLSFRQPSSAPADPFILEVPLMRGSPFLTFIFPPGSPPATPVLTTIYAITGVERAVATAASTVLRSTTARSVRSANCTPLLPSDCRRTSPIRCLTRPCLPLAYSPYSPPPSPCFPPNYLPLHQTWLVYLSAPLTLRQDGSTLAADVPFTGTMRVALLLGSSAQDEEALLDAHVPTVLVGGSTHVGAFRIKYTWRTQQWREPANADTKAPLLMRSLPMHQRLEVSMHSPSSASALRPHCSGSPSGAMGALRGHHNSASARPSITRGNAPWASVRDESVPDASVLAYPTIDGQTVGIQGALWRLKVPKQPSTWRAGPLSSDPQLLDELRASLKQDMAAAPLLPLHLLLWQDSSACRPPGADRKAAGMYNDHHFHYGYFIYAAATVAKFDPAWRDQYRAPFKDLTADYMSAERTAAFPRLRHFDAYALHSWASGLFEFGDERNQESFSGADNAYYAAALLASVLGDQPIATLGAMLAAVEAFAGQTLMHVPLASSTPDSSLSPGYEAVFVDGNRVVGVLWSTKRDAALWFAPPADMEKRVGTQVLPVSPFLTHLFPDHEFAKQLVEWAQPVLSGTATDEWRGFAWALQALYDPQGARTNIAALTAFDDGNSKTNML
ncbi:unnamed protein product, partial [Closterium sp. NIES-65]